MKNTLPAALLVWSLILWNGEIFAWENGENIKNFEEWTSTTIAITKEKVKFLLNENGREDEKESLHQENIQKIIDQTIAQIPELHLSDEQEQGIISILKQPDFRDKLYSLEKKEKIWSPESVILSLILGFLYGWAYFFTIRKIRDKGMPIDAMSFSIFAGTSGMMAVLNGFVPGSLVYAESFILASASVYLHFQNKRHKVPYNEEGLFEKFANNTPLPMVRYDKDGFPLVWNKQMGDETGYDYAEIVEYHKKNGDIMNLLYRWENLKKVRQYLEQIEKSGEWYVNIAFTMTTKSWEEKTFLWATLPDGNGGSIRIATHLKDARDIYEELEKTRELLRKDFLTGIYNRKALEEDLQDILLNKKRETDPSNMVMFMIDIDDFSNFNNGYGHETGDAVLKKFSDFIQANLRGNDRFYRFWWDEFVLLLENTNLEGVVRKLNKVRQTFFEQKFTVEPVGSSWGAIEFNAKLYKHMEVDTVITELRSQADKYMYAVKYYRLIKDSLIAQGKIQKGQPEKNGIGRPIYDEQKNIIGARIVNGYGEFELTMEEVQEINNRQREKESNCHNETNT